MADNGDGNSGVWLSTNGGATFTQMTGLPSGLDLNSISMTADGSKMQATDATGAIWIYNGSTWSSATSPSVPGGWAAIESSGNGSLLIAAEPSGSVWLSFDGGATWQQQNQAGDPPGVATWTDVSCSADGSTMVAVAADGSVWIYNVASGVWTQSTAAGVRDWSAVDVSDNGQTIVAGVDGGPLYISKDGGECQLT